MKIQGDRPLGISDPAQTNQAERLQNGKEGSASLAGVGTGDRVQFSADARLLGSAVRAAEQAPAIRQDVVERARARLEAGQIGADPARLADRIIDSLLS
jgi:flagellar biosynthesis anti-sigma factor FlgM